MDGLELKEWQVTSILAIEAELRRVLKQASEMADRLQQAKAELAGMYAYQAGMEGEDFEFQNREGTWYMVPIGGGTEPAP